MWQSGKLAGASCGQGVSPALRGNLHGSAFDDFVPCDFPEAVPNRMMRRIDQWLANLGYCSRRSAREWVEAGRIKVEGQVATDPGKRVFAEQLLIDDLPADHPNGILLLLHKPLGLICSHESREGPNVYSLLPERWRDRNPAVTTIGRLDKETSGVILLTDQSALVHRLTSPKQKVAKVYRATVDRALSPELIPLFAAGTLLLTGEKEPCAAATLCILDSTTAELTLFEGRYHQVRRMLASQGYHVTALHRLRFGGIGVENLAPGTWCELPLSTFDEKS